MFMYFCLGHDPGLADVLAVAAAPGPALEVGAHTHVAALAPVRTARVPGVTLVPDPSLAASPGPAPSDLVGSVKFIKKNLD